MKKIVLFLLVAIMALGQSMYAQDAQNTQEVQKTKKEKKTQTTQFNPLDNPNEFYLQYGTPGIIWGVAVPASVAMGTGVTVGIVEAIINGLFSWGQNNNPSGTTYVFQNYGIATLTYQHKFKKAKWFGLGADLSYGYAELFEKNKDNTKKNLGHYHLVTPMVAMNFYYFQRKHIELFSGLSVGATFMIDEKNSTKGLFAAHINAFGLSAGGDHLRYHCEFGFGMKGFVNMGIGYKF